MKKTIFTAVLLMTMALGANAQNDAFFDWNSSTDDVFRSNDFESLVLPSIHGDYLDSPAVPIGSGTLLLLGFGMAYVGLRQKKNSKR